MKRSVKYSLLGMVTLAVILACIGAIRDERRQFEYVYVDGMYYNVTNQSASEEGLQEELQRVTQTERVDFKHKTQSEGASNVLPVGTALYRSPTNADAIIYQKPGESDFRTAYRMYGDIAGHWMVYIPDAIA